MNQISPMCVPQFMCLFFYFLAQCVIGVTLKLHKLIKINYFNF